MRSMKKIMGALALGAVLCVSIAGCGTGTDNTESKTTETASEEKILKTAASFAYPSLDVHKEYYGWYTSIYGVSEALFKMNENAEVEPCLATDATVDGNIWTITLNKDATFSNGNPVTPDMVKRNIERVAEVNERFSYLADFTIETVDDDRLIITTPEVYPTLKNDLASPELGIIDLDATTDFDNAPVCTGPFVIDSFEPEGDVTVKKNENYWGGEVQLDGAVFYYMQEDDPKLLAMQSGEIDCYNSVSSAALEVYEADPDTYDVTSIPGARLQFY
ncbi:MAG: ABC transporter substrate-binding protein, partial [Lachnospiraceae bacterium]|nr:ABC transporter substrate-binding protein [Lachnospiraceae bacterium]